MIASIVITLHVLSVFWLVAGVVGRNLVHAMALQATELDALQARHEITSLLERVAVRPGSFAVLVTGGAAAGMRGWPVLGFLQGASTQWVLASLIVYLTIIPVIVLVFLPRARVFQKALADARSEGRITPALQAALRDPAVSAARLYELIMVVVLTFLMVAKPF